ncbi:helix-turn-helix transcriptional regulator [Streptomyces sp. NPDC102351]|uniref:helix-turn-helix transcriptional regulator n=1 Tax=Streptomyces sp. NPDC102351 TaxID=3366158 RepID=UPI00381E1C23
MREHFGDPLTVTDYARKARLSPFHFSRVFKETTGVSPGVFLTALRINEAKRLIGATSMRVVDVCAEVGWASPGSFTSAFTAAVGLPPGRYRRLCREEGESAPGPRPDPHARRGAVAGTVRLPRGHGNARVFLGAFATGVVRHPAAASLVVDVPGDRPSCYTLRDVPAGHWHLLAVAVAAGTGHDPHAVRTELTAHGPATAVTVTAGDVTSAAVRLRPAHPADPPVLLALPALEPPTTAAAHPGCAAAAAAPDAGRLRLVAPSGT